jgi:hypothetical protein
METTYQPIPAKYYEDIQKEEFWDCAVNKWGLDAAKPQQIARNTVIERTSFNPVIRREEGDWWEEEDQTPIKPTPWFQQLLKMSLKEREAHKLAQRMQEEARRLKERSDSRDGQSIFINAPLRARDNIFGPKVVAPKDPGKAKSAYIKLIRDKSKAEEKGIWQTVRRGEKSEKHKDFLREVNCTLRDMCEEVIKSIDQKQQANLLAEANKVIEILDLSLMMVNEKGTYPDSTLEAMLEQLKHMMILNPKDL